MMNIFKRSSHHSRKKLSNRSLSVVVSEGKVARRRLGLSLLRRFKWAKNNGASTIRPPSFVSTIRLAAPRIEALENEFMRRLKHMRYSNRRVDLQQAEQSLQEAIKKGPRYRTDCYASKRLLITRSADDLSRVAHNHGVATSRSSQAVRRPFLTRILTRSSCSDPSLITMNKEKVERRVPAHIRSAVESIRRDQTETMKFESCLRKDHSKTTRKLSIHWDEQSLTSTSRQSQAAVIEVEHQTTLPIALCKPLQKSHSSPIPINTNHLSTNHNPIRSAHLLDQCSLERPSRMSLYACTSAMGNTHTTTSSSSDEDEVTGSLLQYPKKIKQVSLRDRWRLWDLWKNTLANVPSILNCVWRQRVHLTGSREFCKFQAREALAK